MRLPDVKRGDRLKNRLLFRVIKLATGYRAADVVRPSPAGRPSSAIRTTGTRRR